MLALVQDSVLALVQDSVLALVPVQGSAQALDLALVQEPGSEPEPEQVLALALG